MSSKYHIYRVVALMTWPFTAIMRPKFHPFHVSLLVSPYRKNASIQVIKQIWYTSQEYQFISSAFIDIICSGTRLMGTAFSVTFHHREECLVPTVITGWRKSTSGKISLSVTEQKKFQRCATNQNNVDERCQYPVVRQICFIGSDPHTTLPFI